MQPQVIICKDRAEWLEARKDGLGASDAAALLGLSPWKTNVQLWEEKCGLVIPEDIGDKPYVRYGNDAEPLLRSFFALDHPEYRVSFTPYSGGTPELLTENFGTRRFFDAVGGTDGERYYISMRTEKGDWELYVFDTLRAIWLREDATHALDWAYLDGTLYFLDGATGKLMTTGQDYSEEGLVNWSATLCQMDETSHGRKCYSKLYLRADLDAGAWLKVEISTDGKPFRQVFSTHNERAKTLQVPILPVRCDNFRIRLSGKGGCLVKSIIREFALGSEY